jgi:chemotaxis protein methyltransferase CheR
VIQEASAQSRLKTGRSAPSFGYGDYLRFSKLVYERCGLHFPENRRADLERGVLQAFAASTCTSLNEYYQLLLDPEVGAVHFERLANALTISETHFFRDAGQMDALYYHVLPQIISRRTVLRTMRIWSAGCASGEEPYSIAILLRELLPDVDEWSITILGTDINTQALDMARQAIYTEWAFREERAREWRSRYFRRNGSRYELIPEVKRMVTFARLNLVEDVYPSYETNTTLMDLIVCRNVMIYFTEQVSGRLVERFYDCLTYGGWLMVGHTEHSLSIYHRFRVHNFPNAILYQRPEQLPSHEEAAHIVSPTGGPVPIPTVTGARQPAGGPDVSPRLAPAPDRVYIHSLERLGYVHPLERARELLNYGRAEEARELLMGMIEAGSEDTVVYSLLGEACANLGDWAEAERWCRRAIEKDKLALDAYYVLALVLQHQERLDEAIEMMKKVVYIDRFSVLGHFGLADLYHSNGQLPQALKSLDNARRLLEGKRGDELVPGSGGITVRSLREAIVYQQQKWQAEAGET